jgi:hypothetical protein
MTYNTSVRLHGLVDEGSTYGTGRDYYLPQHFYAGSGTPSDVLRSRISFLTAEA